MGHRWDEVTLNLLRMMAGFLFSAHGAQKLFGVLGGEAVELFSLMGFAGFLEFFGGLAILAGFHTRPVAFILSGQMAVAYWMAHGLRGFWPVLNRGELAALYCFVFLFLAARGGGSFSLDARLKNK